MSFSAVPVLEIGSQFAADGFGEVCRLEKAEVNLIQLGQFREFSDPESKRVKQHPAVSAHNGLRVADRLRPDLL